MVAWTKRGPGLTRKKRTALGFFLVLVGLVASLWITAVHITDRQPRHDELHYLFMAYNLKQHGVISHHRTEREIPRPTYRREPLYPILLAGFLLPYGGNDLKQGGPACFLEAGTCPGLIRYLKTLNILLHILLAVATGWAAYMLTARRVPAVAATICLALYTGFIAESNLFYSETLAALFLLLTSTLLYLAFFDKRPRLYASACGVALGLLLLTKAAFYYILVVLLVLLAVLSVMRLFGFLRWSIVGRWALIAGIAWSVITPWMIRNHHITGQWKISGRGGEVLSIRAQYDTMPWSDYPNAYYYFTPMTSERWMRTAAGEDAYARFDRGNTNSYYRTAKQRRGAAHILAEREKRSLTEASLEIIGRNFAKHIALTAAFAWRGAFMKSNMRNQPLPPALVGISTAISVTLVPVAIIMTIWAGLRRRFELWLFLLPAYFSYAFHAFLTHYIPRYSMPLIPVLIITLLICAQWSLRRARPSPRRRAASGAGSG
jgi:4-amino-4-deoxy-L-arabinose transferase-like glycosyltransferase